jgi:DNA invertase Pin-like site-specific DNA recombinase
MNGSAKIQASHRGRLAVVYVRQSDPKQVLNNRESGLNQRALRERLLTLGWKPNRVLLLDEDQGHSAKDVAGRDGFQKLAADVALGKVGIIMGYEVSRLSRNNADWYRLLELCALFDTLIADVDGIYNPRDFNDRLLLGLKGTLSEAELHSLRLRLDAGRLSKAKRGELVHHLPTGYVRDAVGQVTFDPDAAVQERVRLVFRTFAELGSMQKVLRYLVKHGLLLPRRQTSGLYAGEVLWKEPSINAVTSVLKNPAYAGAFAYGRRVAEPARQVPGRRATGRIRQPREQWLALVRDVYPAYITWAAYERNQATIAENRQRMAERLTRRQALRGGAALLTGLVRCGLCGHAMQVAYKDGRFQYTCRWAQARYAKPTCQYLSGQPIDEAVLEEFFRVLRPAEIDALERVSARRVEHHQELLRHLGQEVTRLEYAARRAERQYNAVDPENRLIAATLEKRWEVALEEFEQAKARLSEARAQATQPAPIPAELREAFADVGRRLPDVWPRLSAEGKKSLLRTLVEGVNLARESNGMVQVRIVWRGGLVSARRVRLAVSTRRRSEIEARIVARIEQLATEGQRDNAIAESLNKEGYFPCRGATFTPGIVLKLRCRYGIHLGLGRLRRGELPRGYTIAAMARLLGVDPCWIYRGIRQGRIGVPRDTQFGCYLFPHTREAVRRMKQLKSGKVAQVSFLEEHCDG